MNKTLYMIKLWLRAVRAPFFTATATAGILGAACAWNQTGNFNLPLFLLTLLGIILLNTGTNLVNDYFDHTSGLDALNTNYTKFNGGSRVIQEKLISPGKILTAGIGAFILAGIIGLYLNKAAGGNTILIIGVTGVFLGYFYSASPLRLGYTPLAEIIAGFCCGPLITMGSYYVQARTLDWGIFLVSVPVGLLVSLILFINEFPDCEVDCMARKKTMVVVLGKKKAAKIYCGMLGVVYVVTLAGAAAGILPLFALLSLLTFPLGIKAVKVIRVNYEKVQELLPANGATIGLHLAFALLVTAGYVFDKFF